MSEIVKFPGLTRLDSDPGRILQEAIDADLEGVVILGYDKDGDEYMLSSYADGGTVVWLMERCKHRLITFGESE